VLLSELSHLSATFETDYFIVLDGICRAELRCGYFLCGRLSRFNVDSSRFSFLKFMERTENLPKGGRNIGAGHGGAGNLRLDNF